MPLQTGWEDVETFNPVAFGPYVPAPEIQPIQREIINQTNITEVTQIVETIYKEGEFEPLPPMEFKPATPETYGTIGYSAVLLSILMLGFMPSQEEMS